MLCGMMAINIRKALRKAFKQAKPVLPAAEPQPAENVVIPLLFAPGDGQMPLHVAGRAKEMDVLPQMLTALRMGRFTAHNAALHAPRGLGKSVLLEKLCREAQADGRKVRTVFISASDIDRPEDLYAATLGAPMHTGEQTTKSAPYCQAHQSAAQARQRRRATLLSKTMPKNTIWIPKNATVRCANATLWRISLLLGLVNLSVLSAYLKRDTLGHKGELP